MLTAGLVLAGCSGGGGGDGKPGGGGGGTASRAPASPAPASASAADPAATPAPTAYAFTPDPARTPKTRAEAERLARAVVAGPGAWGPDYVESEPYPSAGDSWPVLSPTCVWEAGSLPADVLSSVTAHSEIPAAGGRGRVRVTATVTVHRTADDADWEMSQSLEEVLRCPEQTLRAGERIVRLMSLGDPGSAGDIVAEDSINERGRFVDDAVGGEHYYGWAQGRVGQVTVAASVRGGPGHTEADLSTATAKAWVTMLNRVESQLKGR